MRIYNSKERCIAIYFCAIHKQPEWGYKHDYYDGDYWELNFWVFGVFMTNHPAYVYTEEEIEENRKRNLERFNKKKLEASAGIDPASPR